MTLAGNVYNLTPAAIMRQQDNKREPIAFEFIPTKDTDYHALYWDVRRGIRNVRGELIPVHLRKPFVYSEYLAYKRKKDHELFHGYKRDEQEYLDNGGDPDDKPTFKAFMAQRHKERMERLRAMTFPA